MLETIGSYYLGQNVNVAKGLEEFTEHEYINALQTGMQRRLEDEKFFNGDQVEYAGIKWEATTLGSTQGKIYKIVLQASFNSKSDVHEVFDIVAQFIKEENGDFTKKSRGQYIWDIPGLNIILISKTIANYHFISLFFTSSSIRTQASQEILGHFERDLNHSKKKLSTLSMINFFHNTNNYTDDENAKWCWLRAIEWGAFPIFLTQPIVPILLLYFHWGQILLFLLITGWLWALVRYKFVSIPIATIGMFFVFLKWVSIIGMGIYFLTESQYLLAVISGFYPLISSILIWAMPTTNVGLLQNIFMDKIGYKQEVSHIF